MEKRMIIISAAVVVLIMAIVMVVSAYGFGISYGEPELLRIAIFGEVLTAIFLVWFIRRNSSFEAIGFSTLKIRGLVWYLPILLIVLYQVVLVVNALVASYDNLSAATIQLVAIVFVTTLFVGFNEEVLFRGIILRNLHPEQHPYRAILISAALFSSFHLINLIALVPLTSMIVQLANTFLFGLFFALIALKLNNLWPLIIFHALWDFSNIAADVLNVDLAIPTLITQVFVAIAILVQLILLKQHDLSHLKGPLTPNV
ncbi:MULTISPECIES: CPBP family intramembrane glutamic endopeptidase [Exiguobacterium]|uniref:CPBP family intramembrane glutamic endopeptidase n=1 Tax=Exiguobacterium TaxID=33986 RepID=UPI000479AB26|nr:MULTISPECIES: type II CAAX endopeptidase family protein [Exiguobacterium]MCT4780708.1 CPBP family intramembrane metalloprotease [Exiguobacterium soli]